MEGNTLSRLKSLVGKKGFVPIRGFGEIGFVVLVIEPPNDLETDTEIERAINWSKFTVKLEEGTSIDGRDTLQLFGYSISCLNDGRY